jgi:hypothetical protein
MKTHHQAMEPETDDPTADRHIDRPVETLRRWQDSGAVWRVVTRTPSTVVVALLTCSAGEEVDRITSTDPELIAFVGTRLTSEA